EGETLSGGKVHAVVAASLQALHGAQTDTSSPRQLALCKATGVASQEPQIAATDEPPGLARPGDGQPDVKSRRLLPPRVRRRLDRCHVWRPPNLQDRTRRHRDHLLALPSPQMAFPPQTSGKRSALPNRLTVWYRLPSSLSMPDAHSVCIYGRRLEASHPVQRLAVGPLIPPLLAGGTAARRGSSP